MVRRILRAAVLLVFLAPGQSLAEDFDPPADDEILSRQSEANGFCRGGAGEETDAWCTIRDGLTDILVSRGWCYGKQGEIGADMKWQRCGPSSLPPG